MSNHTSMSERDSTMTGTIGRVDPVRNTRNGNTRQRIVFADDLRVVTSPDSSAGQSAQNLRPGDVVMVHVDSKGHADRVTLLQRPGVAPAPVAPLRERLKAASARRAELSRRSR